MAIIAGPIQIDPTQTNVGIDREGNHGAPAVRRWPRCGWSKVDNLSGLQKQEQVLFKALPGAGTPGVCEGSLAEACLEQSNCNTVQGMSKLVTLSREFEMITKVIETFSQCDRKAATDIASSR